MSTDVKHVQQAGVIIVANGTIESNLKSANHILDLIFFINPILIPVILINFYFSP